VTLGQPARQPDADGAHRSVNRPARQGRERAVRAKHHVFERGVVRHHRDKNLRVSRRGGGTISHDGIELLQLVGTGTRAIVDGERVARLQQVPRHRQAHVAESDE